MLAGQAGERGSDLLSDSQQRLVISNLVIMAEISPLISQKHAFPPERGSGLARMCLVLVWVTLVLHQWVIF